MRHKHKPPQRHVTPVNTSIGLSSALNQDFVLQVFASSSQDEIERVLRQARYRPPQGVPRAMTAVDRNAAVEQDVASYLRTPDGVRLRNQRLQEVLNREAADWLKSPQGQQEYSRIRAGLLVEATRGDSDLFAKACAEALQRDVERWLRSPLGQAQLEEEKRRAIRMRTAEEAPPKQEPSWIYRHARGTTDAR